MGLHFVILTVCWIVSAVALLLVQAEHFPDCTVSERNYYIKTSMQQKTGSVKCGWSKATYYYQDRLCSLDFYNVDKPGCCQGYYNNTHGNCVPICSNPCQNGYCSQPETCTCNKGYSLANGVCKPICSNCQNGLCVAPNECTCSEGFERNHVGLCVPRCTGICLNGNCDINGNCICAPDYFSSTLLVDIYGLTNATLCIPNCDKPCENGSCIGSNQCRCHDGFKQSPIPFKCEPICRADCTNGECVAPNICQCLQGYRFEVDQCVPVCNPPCHNADCVQPNVCQCYEKFIESNSKSNRCIPTCDPPCENGICNEPDKCSCKNGYVPSHIATEEHKCVPFCDPQYIYAENGECVAPNVFRCNENFRLSELGVNKSKIGCEAICSKSCINGRCVGENRCECFDGYSSASVQKHICLPLCDIPCKNGDCVAPNECQCHEGHYKDTLHSHICIPSCDPTVVNCSDGRCTDVNMCQCNVGYSLKVINGVEQCQPVCDPDCLFASCVKPGFCKCWPGYTTSQESTSHCKPVCMNGCENATCVSPDECKCLEGYVALDSNSCTPFCDAAIVDCSFNGDCIGPNNCRCHDGYTLQTSDFSLHCAPQCTHIPDNAQCIYPGEYRCLSGFELFSDPENNDRCVPSCNSQCGNGTCSGPNTCSCFDGFKINLDGYCTSICESTCQEMSGTCVDNECQCLQGYKNLENPYECTPFCEQCEFGECVEPGECICNDGYDMFNESARCEPRCSNCSTGAYCKAPEECACREGWTTSIGEDSIIYCQFSSVAGFQRNISHILWLAVVGILAIATFLLIMLYIMYKQSSRSYGTSVKMSDLRVVE